MMALKDKQEHGDELQRMMLIRQTGEWEMSYRYGIE